MIEPNEETEFWKAYHEEQQERRDKRRSARSLEISQLQQDGFKVQRITPYQFRVNGRLDLYPVNNRFHDIKTGRRGRAGDLAAFARSFQYERKETR